MGIARFWMKMLYFVLLYDAFDFSYLIRVGHHGVAYTTNRAGFATGVLAGLAILRAGWVDRDGYDLVSLIRRGGRVNPNEPAKPP